MVSKMAIRELPRLCHHRQFDGYNKIFLEGRDDQFVEYISKFMEKNPKF